MQVPYRIHATFFCDIQKLNKQPSKGAESYFRHFYGRIEANCILFDLQVCGYNLPAIHGAYPGYQVNNIHVYTIMFVLFVSYIFPEKQATLTWRWQATSAARTWARGRTCTSARCVSRRCRPPSSTRSSGRPSCSASSSRGST